MTASPYTPPQIARLTEHTELSKVPLKSEMAALIEEAASHNAAGVCVLPDALPALCAMRREVGGVFRAVTVLNFPGQPLYNPTGLNKIARRLLRAGANDIDLYVPRRHFEDSAETGRALVSACFRAVAENPEARLKIILETGDYHDKHGDLEAEALQKAARIAIESGVHFLKTCTGKHPTRPNADPESVMALCEVIKETDRPLGLKISGGVSQFEQAVFFLRIVERMLGAEFIKPSAMRFGSSKLLGGARPAY